MLPEAVALPEGSLVTAEHLSLFESIWKDATSVKAPHTKTPSNAS